MTKEELLNCLHKANRGPYDSALTGFVTVRGKRYKVFVYPDIAARGKISGKGCSTTVWKAYGNVNKHGVQPGCRIYQGPLSVTKVLKLIESIEK